MLQILSLLSLGLLIKTVKLQDNMCVDSIYMKIHYTTKFIDSHVSVILNVSSAYECLELCRDHGSCKSVGIKTNSMTCYLYDGRVYAGLSGINSSDIIYYWQLEPVCPTHLGYIEDPTSKICTKFNSTRVTWFKAQKQCENEGGFLFMVDSLDSQNVMTTYDTSGGQFTFVGATDINDEGVWEWFNGVPVSQSACLPSEPNNGGNNQHCMVDVALGSSVFGLGDISCHKNLGFICQIPTKQTYLP